MVVENVRVFVTLLLLCRVTQAAARSTDQNQVSFAVAVAEGALTSTSGTNFEYQVALTPIITSISDNVGLVAGNGLL